jgi:hypothetical protein
MKINTFYKLSLLGMLSLAVTSFKSISLKGTWAYCGDVFNGKVEGAPTDYKLERKYSADHYDSFLLEKGEKPQKYESGDYTLNADTCLETQTFSAQESKLLNVTIHYVYSLKNDTLTLTGTLPSGSTVKEFWKKK